jgi:hypothetical protein
MVSFRPKRMSRFAETRRQTSTVPSVPRNCVGFDGTSSCSRFETQRVSNPKSERSDVIRGVLAWSHYRVLLHVADSESRAWYRNEALDQQWSTRQLQRRIFE